MHIKSAGVIKYVKYLGVIAAVITAVGITWAAFSDKGKVLGSTFSVGNSDIKLLENLSGITSQDNLKDELSGPNFVNLTPNWTQDYLLKIYNNGSTALQVTSNSEYETANDPDDLRSYIYVEPMDWDDSNGNGQLDLGEEGSSYGKKSITKWKTEGFDLQKIDMGTTRGFILRFSTTNLSDTKQGKTGSYDFVINAIQM